MREIDATTAADYLRDAGWIPNGAEVLVRELSGGVSNIVLRVDLSGKPPFVLKQCRERLRVPMEWRARLDRIWTEHAALEVLRAILPERVVPEILFEDRRNYLFAMTCAPDDAVTWKTHLMAGRVDPTVATRLGTILGTIHAEAPGHPALRGTLSDTSLFDELRVDPYYRTVAQAHPDLAPRIDALIDLMDRPEDERTLVLGDFSPKNILVHSGGLILLDFECAHAGDPAFDLGFFLTHLLLKVIRAALQNSNSDRGPDYLELARLFWNSYLARRNLNLEVRSELVPRAILHTAACCLARVDGKSPVEYLDVHGQAVARSFARELLQSEAATWDHVLKILDNAIVRGMAWHS
jgi:5-methylthioribose kinase